MTKLNKLFVLLLAIPMVLTSCMSAPEAAAPVVTEITGDATQELANAEIYSVYPTVVLPGTLMCVKGAGFGETAGVINLGGVDITTYLGWDDETIWFRIPEGIAQDAELQVGYEYAEPLITTAPEGSITVEWSIDATKAQEIIDAKYTFYDLKEAPQMTAPLRVKGQWSKSEGTYGLKDEGWDGGSRQEMYNVPGTGKWIAEAVYTPEAIESFGNSLMAFALEDGDDEFRNLSQFESDFAFIIKKRWAGAVGLTNDPAVKISEDNVNFDAATRTIKVQYPLPE